MRSGRSIGSLFLDRSSFEIWFFKSVGFESFTFRFASIVVRQSLLQEKRVSIVSGDSCPDPLQRSLTYQPSADDVLGFRRSVSSFEGGSKIAERV